jgi:hypothetical protein
VAIVDVSVPEAPVLIGSLAAPQAMNGAEVVDNVAYVTDPSGVVALDASDPTSPTTLGMVNVPGARRLVHHRGQLYVAAGSAGVAVVEPQCPDQAK